jgi:hypothetical protein
VPSADRRRSFSGEAFLPSLRDALKARGSRRFPGVRRRRTSAASRMRRKRARASSSTKACWSRSCGPGTGDPVAQGDVGEVVVTTLFNTDLPSRALRNRRPLGGPCAGTSAVRPHQRAPSRAGWVRAGPDHQVKGIVRPPPRRSPKS